MKFKRFMMLAALLVSSVAAMVAQEMQMPPIPIDKNVKIGKLDNGLTYYIRKNNWPENVANFYIAQRVGWPTSWSTWPSTVRSISPTRHCSTLPVALVLTSVAT